MARHPLSHKQSSIIPLTLPSPSTQFSSPENMLHPPKSSFCLSEHMVNNYDSRVQKTAQNYRRWNTMEADVTSMMEDDSGASTPLWGSTNPSRSPSHGKNINYRCLSPSSKAQAIARGQKELMEMVSRMPESCFELTLKDLVEQQQPVVVEPKQESFAEGRGTIDQHTYNKEKGKKKMKKNPKPQFNRSGSIDNGGLLLKMVFPFSLGSKCKNKKKKKNESNTNHNSKVSPKPTVSDESGKIVDKEWWKKRSGSSESEGGGSNLNSGSSKNSHSSSIGSSSSSSSGNINNTGHRHKGNGCLAFIFTRKSKASR
ncbi:hypothetical protein ES332_D05G263400v1 [Gossypium tomentosum]|uniref:Uncharacterized protein n=1 Tax=Gossypium tomentosum TaxID=34277 RepID=A0A5D2L3D5_GOSTO|nr:hypothetical protein ES332_D05G263400v1 [Gossypium tomentosum]